MTEYFSFTAFSADKITDHFNITASQPLEYAAMRFMFRAIKDEIATKSENKAARNSEIADLTIQKIEFGYELYKYYGPEFLKDTEDPSPDALTLAVICDEFTQFINGPMEGNNDPEKPTRFHDDRIDDDLADAAHALWKEGYGLFTGESVNENPSPYGVLLAHIHIYNGLNNLHAFYGEFPPEELKNIVDRHIPVAQSVLRKDTELGSILEAYLEETKNRLQCTLWQNGHIEGPNPRRAHLSLVPEVK